MFKLDWPMEVLKQFDESMKKTVVAFKEAEAQMSLISGRNMEIHYGDAIPAIIPNEHQGVVWCDACNKFVDKCYVTEDYSRRSYNITVQCHGDTEAFEIDRFELTMRNGPLHAFIPTITAPAKKLKKKNKKSDVKKNNIRVIRFINGKN